MASADDVNVGRSNSMRIIVVIVLSFLMAGCYSSKVAPDTTERMNRHLAMLEKGVGPDASDEDKSRLAQLFFDRPEYAALATRNEAGGTLPRMRTSVPPKYPLGALLSNAKALVKVAFIVSETGAVEEARIFEASDSRFSTAAIEAVKAWTFYPGALGGSTTKFLFVVPLQFDGSHQ